ncbi:hypothetical protein Avbf_03476 [Armadillidium vulgare]|nr:hypothetical protein Avbf_03476 [Armadillidium vulgare]
MYPKRRNQKV